MFIIRNQFIQAGLILFIAILILSSVVSAAVVQISNAGDLQEVADSTSTSGGNEYILTSDIDLSGISFTPIGTYGSPFSGTFDGKGHSIIGLSVTDTTKSGNIGLFGYISNATIRNLVLEQVVISSNGNNVSALIGSAGGSTNVIRNCAASGSVLGADNVGGLVGRLGSGSVENCYATVSVASTKYYAGGLIGFARSGTTITDSYATGSVSGGAALGGLIGHCSGSVKNCYATGTVTGVVISYDDPNYGPIRVNPGTAGGLIGHSQGNISHSFSFGKSVSSTRDVGSLIGTKMSGTVDDCGSWSEMNVAGTDVAQKTVNGTPVRHNDVWDSQTFFVSHGFLFDDGHWQMSINPEYLLPELAAVPVIQPDIRDASHLSEGSDPDPGDRPVVTTVFIHGTPAGSIDLSTDAATGALTADVRDATGLVMSDESVLWSSSNSSVVTVDTEGGYTALTVGTSNITATSLSNSSAVAVVTLTVIDSTPIPSDPGATSIVLRGLPSQNIIDMYTDAATGTLTAYVRDATGVVMPNESVFWFSSNSSVVTVDTEGRYTALTVGTSNITATSLSNSSAVAVVTLTVIDSTPIPSDPVATSIVLRGLPSQNIIDLYTDAATGTLTADVRDATGVVMPNEAVIWSSSNSSVVTVDTEGGYTVQNAGTSNITAKSRSNSSAVAVVTLTVIDSTPIPSDPVATSIVLRGLPSQNIIDLYTNAATGTLTADVRDETGVVMFGESVLWFSSNSSVVTVDTEGRYTALNVGTSNITTTSRSNSSAVAVVTLTVIDSTPTPDPGNEPVATTVVINGMPADNRLDLAFDVVSGTLTAIVRDETGTIMPSEVVNWTSSNVSVMTVSDDGRYTALSVGTANITATAVNNSSASVSAMIIVIDTTSFPGQGDTKSVTLTPGWNFISVPKTIASGYNTASSLFGRINTGGRTPLGYDANVSAWITLSGSDVIRPLTGYWIYAASSDIIQLTYPVVPTVPAMKTLYPGWNAIGLSSDASLTAANALSGTSWRTLLPWNIATGKWDAAVINGGSGIHSPERLMTIGNGYWLYVTEGGVLTGLTA